MSALPPIQPVGSAVSAASLGTLEPLGPAGGTGFADLLAQGVQNMENRVAHADELVRQFAADGNVPVHQVTLALEQARLSVELAMQVRARLTEAYRDLMNMQL